MKELLQEAAEVLRRGQADEMINLANRIDAALAEPEPDAMDVAMQIYYDCFLMGNGKFEAEKAAALIESYGRRVPRVFVEEILDEAWNCLTDRPEGNVLQKIAAKYGVKMEDAK